MQSMYFSFGGTIVVYFSQHSHRDVFNEATNCQHHSISIIGNAEPRGREIPKPNDRVFHAVECISFQFYSPKRFQSEEFIYLIGRNPLHSLAHSPRKKLGADFIQSTLLMLLRKSLARLESNLRSNSGTYPMTFWASRARQPCIDAQSIFVDTQLRLWRQWRVVVEWSLGKPLALFIYGLPTMLHLYVSFIAAYFLHNIQVFQQVHRSILLGIPTEDGRSRFHSNR